MIWFRLSHSGYGRIVCINRAPSVGNTAQAANKKKRDGIMVTLLRLIRNLGSQLLLDSVVSLPSYVLHILETRLGSCVPLASVHRPSRSS